MITTICECGKQFEYELKPGYPRKYCDECSTKKKAEYAERQGNAPVSNPNTHNSTPMQTGNSNRNTTMYVSYAKDVFCQLVEKGLMEELTPANKTMETAINLVRQAKIAFEQ